MPRDANGEKIVLGDTVEMVRDWYFYFRGHGSIRCPEGERLHVVGVLNNSIDIQHEEGHIAYKCATSVMRRVTTNDTATITPEDTRKWGKRRRG